MLPPLCVLTGGVPGLHVRPPLVRPLATASLTAVRRLTDDLVHEKEKFKSVSDELDTTFSEMSAY